MGRFGIFTWVNPSTIQILLGFTQVIMLNLLNTPIPKGSHFSRIRDLRCLNLFSFGDYCCRERICSFMKQCLSSEPTPWEHILFSKSMSLYFLFKMTILEGLSIPLKNRHIKNCNILQIYSFENLRTANTFALLMSNEYHSLVLLYLHI